MTYVAYGLRIHSDIFLPGLVSVTEVAGSVHTADVVVQRGSPCQPSPSDVSEKRIDFPMGKHSAQLFWPDIGCFRVSQGRQILIEPIPGVAEHLLRLAVVGPVLSLLLFQRGFLVLHASAIALRCNDNVLGAVGFLGESGQGKSTMATALFKRNHQPLSDDTVGLKISMLDEPVPTGVSIRTKGQFPWVYPALPHFKLRPPSVEIFGETKDMLRRWHPDQESYVLPTVNAFSLDPAPLHCLYVLEEDDSIKLSLLPPQEALMSLLKHSSCMRVLPDADIDSDFLKCAQLVRQVPIFRLQRPKDFRHLEDVARLIEDHYQSLLNDPLGPHL